MLVEFEIWSAIEWLGPDRRRRRRRAGGGTATPPIT